jgi:DNA invertase Pin-like site-specific DNA recombinase
MPPSKPPVAPRSTDRPSRPLIVTRLDRLARSTRDLLNVLEQVSSAGATFKSLADTWADTTTPHCRILTV